MSSTEAIGPGSLVFSDDPRDDPNEPLRVLSVVTIGVACAHLEAFGRGVAGRRFVRRLAVLSPLASELV